ncbi:hypothetical protein DVH24_004891 [Malus domestica]|uniref:RNase H type-1 domain-containing protein n=1 Tax=Malus domestica TaxID=3750 RepID=A0A498IG63_MALDO|nr:hypothetical protein DVH24_004891 [Malus domestica]
MAFQQGFSNITVESDSLEVILCLKGKIDNSVLSPRSANSAADYVASHQGMEMCDVYVERPPSLLVGILNKDGLPCPLN